MSALATGASGGMTFRIVDKNEATAKTVPKNIFKLSNYQNLYIKFSFCAIKSVVLGQSGSSVSRSIVTYPSHRATHMLAGISEMACKNILCSIDDLKSNILTHFLEITCKYFALRQQKILIFVSVFKKGIEIGSAYPHIHIQ